MSLKSPLISKRISYEPNQSRSGCYRLNSNLKTLSNWAQKLNFFFFQKKCKCVLFTMKRIYNDTVIVNINGHILKTESWAKHHGITFDRLLTWDKHVSLTKVQIKKKIWLIEKIWVKVIRIYKNVLIALYKTLVRLLLEYGAEVWYDNSNTNLRKLETINTSHNGLLRSKSSVPKEERFLERWELPL